MARPNDHGAGRCPACGKVRYYTRRDAKKAARTQYPGDHLATYECHGFWHIGHLPKVVIEGKAGRPNIHHRGMDYDGNA